MVLLQAVLVVLLLRLHAQDINAVSLSQALVDGDSNVCAAQMRRDCSNSFGDEKACSACIHGHAAAIIAACKNGGSVGQRLRQSIEYCGKQVRMTKPKRSKQFPPESVTPRLPEFSWATLPVGWHSSNSSGVWSPEDTRVLSKYAIITLEKMQGIDTVVPAATRARKGLYWCQNINNESDLSACQIPTALRGTDDQHRDAAKAIKSFNPRAVVLSYLNSVIQYPWYGAARSLASHPDWWLRNSTGGIMHNLESGRPANESWLTYDHSVPAAASAWSKACLDLTASGDIDGCYVDGCTKVPHPLAPAKQTAYGPAKMAMLVALQKQVPAPLICGSNGKVYPGLGGSQIQNWGKAKKYSKREIPMLMTAMKAGVLFEAHGSAVCHAGGDPHDAAVQTELAAFLVAADRYAYYMCSSWSGTRPVWYPVYDMPIGPPKANATLGSDGVWRREFESASVQYDTKTETGRIHWANSTTIREG